MSSDIFYDKLKGYHSFRTMLEYSADVSTATVGSATGYNYVKSQRTIPVDYVL